MPTVHSAPTTAAGRGASGRRRRCWALVAVVAVALNLRAPIAAVSAMLHPLAADLRLPVGAVSVLSTLPTLCLGLFAFLGPRLRRRLGDDRLVMTCLATIAAGDIVRLLPTPVALFAGTTLVGAGIGVANVAVPGLVKRDFPGRFTAVTGGTAAAMTLGAAGAAAAGQELTDRTDGTWTGALATICLPLALVALVLWLPRAAARLVPADGNIADRDRIPGPRLHACPVAWAVTAFFGTTTVLAYSVLAWLPSLVVDQGVVRDGGLVLAVSSLGQVLGAAGGPVLLRVVGDARALGAAAAGVTAAGLAGVALSPSGPGVWAAAVVLGFSQGTAFNLALTFIGLRSPDAPTTASLSAMAQGLGYLIGVAGPLGTGLLHAWTDRWDVPLAALLATAAAQALTATAAGRERLVQAS